MLLLWCVGGCAVAWPHELRRAMQQDSDSINEIAEFFKFFTLTLVSCLGLAGCAATSYNLWPRDWDYKSNAYAASHGEPKSTVP